MAMNVDDLHLEEHDLVKRLEEEVFRDLEALAGDEFESSRTELPGTNSSGNIRFFSSDLRENPMVHVRWGNWQPAEGITWAEANDYRKRGEIERDGIYRIFFTGPPEKWDQFIDRNKRERKKNRSGKWVPTSTARIASRLVSKSGNISRPFATRPIYLGYTHRPIRERLVEHLGGFSGRFSRYRVSRFEERDEEAGNIHLEKMRKTLSQDKDFRQFHSWIKFQYKTPHSYSSELSRIYVLQAAEYAHAMREIPILGTS